MGSANVSKGKREVFQVAGFCTRRGCLQAAAIIGIPAFFGDSARGRDGMTIADLSLPRVDLIFAEG
jgi:hypothetical protein